MIKKTEDQYYDELELEEVVESEKKATSEELIQKILTKINLLEELCQQENKKSKVG